MNLIVNPLYNVFPYYTIRLQAQRPQERPKNYNQTSTKALYLTLYSDVSSANRLFQVYNYANFILNSLISTAFTTLTSSDSEKLRQKDGSEKKLRTTFVQAVSLSLSTAIAHPLSVIATSKTLIGYDGRGPIQIITEDFDKSYFTHGLSAHILFDVSKFFLRSIITEKVISICHFLGLGRSFQVFPHSSSKNMSLTDRWNRLVIMNLVQTISEWLSSGLLFPLGTVRYRLEAQGTQKRNPLIRREYYRSFWQAILTMCDQEGWQGFFSGFQGHLMSIIPQMTFTLGVYAIGHSLIFFAKDRPDSLYSSYLNLALNFAEPRLLLTLPSE